MQCMGHIESLCTLMLFLQEFYFKCGGHTGRPGVKEDDCVALDMIRTNTVNIECPLCADEK